MVFVITFQVGLIELVRDVVYWLYMNSRIM